MTVKALDPAAVAGLEEEPVIKVWRTVLDERTRDSHRLADGQARFVNEPFQVGEAVLMEPRDPDGPPEETTNCRCRVREYALSQLPAEFLPQIIGRLTESEKQFLNQGTRVAQVAGQPPATGPQTNARPISVRGAANRVIIAYSDGTGEIRTGGSRSWRNNNPGNLIDSPFATSHGAIGAVGGIAFPDEATGRQALRALMHGGVYQGLSLDRAIERYAPPQGGNPTAQYQAFVRKRLGKSGNEVLNTFSASEMNDLVNAIIQFEGWQAGTVNFRKSGPP